MLWEEAAGSALGFCHFFFSFFGLAPAFFAFVSQRLLCWMSDHRPKMNCPEETFQLQSPPNKMNPWISPLERFNSSFQPQTSNLLLQLSPQTPQRLLFSRWNLPAEEEGSAPTAWIPQAPAPEFPPSSLQDATSPVQALSPKPALLHHSFCYLPVPQGSLRAELDCPWP